MPLIRLHHILPTVLQLPPSPHALPPCTIPSVDGARCWDHRSTFQKIWKPCPSRVAHFEKIVEETPTDGPCTRQAWHRTSRLPRALGSTGSHEGYETADVSCYQVKGKICSGVDVD